jgi:hypothetical protein
VCDTATAAPPSLTGRSVHRGSSTAAGGPTRLPTKFLSSSPSRTVRSELRTVSIDDEFTCCVTGRATYMLFMAFDCGCQPSLIQLRASTSADEMNAFFNLPNPSGRTGPSASDRNEYLKQKIIFLGSGGRPTRGADNLTVI